MSLLQRFASRHDPGKEAQLAEQVTTLETTLARCKEIARRSRRFRRTLVGAVGLLMLATGYVLGFYHEPIGRTVAHVVFRHARSKQTQVVLPIRKAIMRRRFACFALSPKAETRARNLTLA